MLIVLFGVPGAGKSYVGRVLAQTFGFHFHDADRELPEDMRRALATKQAVTDAMRDNFFGRVIEIAGGLRQHHDKLAIAQAFVKETHRRQLLSAIPDARFVLVQSRRELIAQRFARRSDYLIDFEDACRIALAFERPLIPHHVLENNAGDAALIRQLEVLLPQFYGAPL